MHVSVESSDDNSRHHSVVMCNCTALNESGFRLAVAENIPRLPYITVSVFNERLNDPVMYSSV